MIPHPASSVRRNAQRAFTLIELLVVVAVIAILAGLILQTSGFVQEKAATSRAKTEIAALESALESYKIDNGTYPTANGGDTSTRELIKVLALDPINDGTKIYFEIPPNMLSVQNKNAPYETNLAASTLVDPFGNPYRYEFPGDPDRSGEFFFDLWSQGKKNSTDEVKWITNW